MTNWMTAAGIALIAGGLATLICFRTVLFGGDGRRARGNPQAGIQPKSRRARGNRRRNRSPEPVAEDSVLALPPAPAPVSAPAEEEDSRSGLALIGLAEEPEPEIPYAPEHVEPHEPYADPQDPYAQPHEVYAEEHAPYAEDQDLFAYEDEPVRDFEPEPAFEPVPAESAYREERYGHRVEGWVRPEYRHVPEEPPSGEYWTPIPVGLEPDPEPSAKGYGWPMAVERLPAAGDYEPATGFDLAPVEHEPTEVVSALPPIRKRRDRTPVGDRANRIRLPRSWAARDDKYQEPAAREWRTDNDVPPRRRRAESTQMLAAVTEDLSPAARRRPRPRPRPSVEPPDRSTTMYVSRHAAEPPPR